MVYISVTKVACTSLRWMVADLAGEDLDSFTTEIGGQQSRLMTIHGSRSRWKNTPQLSQMSMSELQEINPNDDWFVFAVIRDPWSRLWSAWQSKFLVRHARFFDRFGNEPWFPRVPSRPEDVIEDFRRFVFERPWETYPELMMDSHFRPQVRSVCPGGVNYTKIYNLTEMSTLFDDIRGHLDAVGHPSELYVPRANETPLPLTAEALSGGVLEEIQAAYKEDFDVFGDRWDANKLKMAPSGWTQDAIDHAAYHTVANERIGDLRREARRIRGLLEDSRREVRELKRGQLQKGTGRAKRSIEYFKGLVRKASKTPKRMLLPLLLRKLSGTVGAAGNYRGGRK